MQAPMVYARFVMADKRDVVVGPFGSDAAAEQYGQDAGCAEARYLGAVTRLTPVGLAKEIVRLRDNTIDAQWSATVTRWDQNCGFATDRQGITWFLSRDDLPGQLEALQVGTLIGFSGSPYPQPGKKYPRAYSIRILRDVDEGATT